MSNNKVAAMAGLFFRANGQNSLKLATGDVLA
jgi:hypothetical protein